MADAAPALPGPGSENVTEPIPSRGRWASPPARGTARAGRPRAVTTGDVLTVLGGTLLLAFSALPFVSYTDGRFVAVKDRNDLSTSWTAWSPGTFLAPLSWVAILAAVLVAVLGVLRVLDRGHRTVFGLRVSQVRVLVAGLSFLILFSFAVSSKTVLFGDDRPQLTEAGIMVDSTLSLDSGGYLMLLAALTMLVGTVMTARGTGGPTVWPLPDVVRTMFAKRTPDQPPINPLDRAPLPAPASPYAFNGYGPGSVPPNGHGPGAYPPPRR